MAFISGCFKSFVGTKYSFQIRRCLYHQNLGSLINGRCLPSRGLRPSCSLHKGLESIQGLELIKVADETLKISNPLVIQKIADYFKTLGIPPSIEKYGHPVMMAIMILFLGGSAAYYGWTGRLNQNKKKGAQQKAFHSNLATVFWLLAFAGASGGTLSVAMQGYPIWKSAHAITALTVLGGLTANAWIAFTGFGDTVQKRQSGRKLHAYLGTGVMVFLVVHILTGLAVLQPPTA
eukprot:jgi/Galph1/1976/GphlegSOOS_G655.1